MRPTDRPLRRLHNDWSPTLAGALTGGARPVSRIELPRPAVDVHAVLSESAARVWALVGNPGSVAQWNPVVDFVRLAGPLRVLELVTGDAIVDRIDQCDDAGHRMQYTVTAGLAPGACHRGQLALTANGARCTVCYQVWCGAKHVPDLLAGAVPHAVDNLVRMFG